MSERGYFVLFLSVGIAAITAVLVFVFLAQNNKTYHRRTYDGVDCLVDRHEEPVDCNWGR